MVTELTNLKNSGDKKVLGLDENTISKLKGGDVDKYIIEIPCPIAPVLIVDTAPLIKGLAFVNAPANLFCFNVFNTNFLATVSEFLIRLAVSITLVAFATFSASTTAPATLEALIISSATFVPSIILLTPLATFAASIALSASLAALNAALAPPPTPGIKANAVKPKLIAKFFAISPPLEPLFISAANCNPVPVRPALTPTAPPAKLAISAAVAAASNLSAVAQFCTFPKVALPGPGICAAAHSAFFLRL